MSTQSFVHLHCHSHFSLLDGASPIKQLVAKARAEGMNALALTDHGNLYGALDFYRAAKAEGINPILGYEAYIASGSRFSREADANQEASYHLTLLAQNRTGFKNLIKLSSKAFLEGFYRKPRIDKELLKAHSEGLICLSGCVSGEFSRAILRGDNPEFCFEQAAEVARWFADVFGPRYFIEIQNNNLEIQRMAMEGAVEVARRVGLPLVATSDAHYVNREDAVAQDVLLCINTGRFRTDTQRMKMEGDEFFLRSPADMYAAFPGFHEAVAQSQAIADTVDIDLELGKRHFPTYHPPDEQPSADYLRQLCIDGLKECYAEESERLVDGQLVPIVLERLERELSVINTLGFANYFLIVWDFVRFARERGIPAAARGSGVGSLVAFALKLSHVCPMQYDLLFERFLDESRKEAPDIDIDFCKDRRGEVIDYVKDKYGAANVAQIGTFGTLAAKAAIRDVGRVMGLSIPRVDAVIAMVPDELGISLEAALTKGADLKRAYESDAEVRELLDLARKIEGLARNIGTHAAAVVIADKPLDEYVPLQRVTGKDEIITQWAMGDVEQAGLLKMDFLGLKNLTVLAKAIDLIEQTTGERVNPYRFPLDDQETFDLLCRGETKGIFQLESGGIRDLLQRMKPDHFHDIIATNALYRPGPLEGGMVEDYIQVKHGRKKPVYKHAVMEDVLGETHGVMVYQEQVMRILNRLGGISLPNAYTCIKAISKKKLPTIAKFREEFVDGAQVQGLGKNDAVEMFELVEKFAGYGFNKSHSTAYALIAYMTAYLKAHWPVEFMAALLSGDIHGRNFKKKDNLVDHIEDCRRMKIDVQQPDVNRSQPEFSVSEGKIVFGLSAIKGCGLPAAQAIMNGRKDRPYSSVFDLCERVDASLVNRSTLESLVKAGAMDSLKVRRSQAAAVLDKAQQGAAAKQADRRRGQKGFFDDDDEDPATTGAQQGYPTLPEWDDRQRLGAEKEVLGYYLTSHPLAEYEDLLSTYTSHTTVEAAALNNKHEVTVGGMISALKLSHTRNPKPGQTNTRYGMFDLEDTSGILRTICWAEEYARSAEVIEENKVVLIRGAIDKRPGSEEANLFVNEILPLVDAPTRFTRGVSITLDEAKHPPEDLQRLYEILRGYPGNCDVQFVVSTEDGRRVVCKSRKLKVELDMEMRRRVAELLGPKQLQLLAKPQSAAPGKSTQRNGYGRGPGRG